MNRYIYITIVVLIGGVAQAFAESLPLLPDHQLTPGVARTDLTLQKIAPRNGAKTRAMLVPLIRKWFFRRMA